MERFHKFVTLGFITAIIGAVLFGDVPNATFNQYIGMSAIMLGMVIMGYSINLPKEEVEPKTTS